MCCSGAEMIWDEILAVEDEARREVLPELPSWPYGLRPMLPPAPGEEERKLELRFRAKMLRRVEDRLRPVEPIKGGEGEMAGDEWVERCPVGGRMKSDDVVEESLA